MKTMSTLTLYIQQLSQRMRSGWLVMGVALHGLFFQSLAIAQVQDPDDLLPDDIKDEDAIDVVKFLLENAGVIISTALILIALLKGGSMFLNALTDFQKSRDVKELLGTVAVVLIVVVGAVLLGYIAQQMASGIA